MPDDGEDRRNAARQSNSLIERAMRTGKRAMPESDSPRSDMIGELNAPRDMRVQPSVVAGATTSKAPHAEPPIVPQDEGSARTASVDQLAAPSQTPTRESSRLIELDFEKLQAQGFITPNAERTRTTEEFRLIKRALLQDFAAARRSGAKNANLIMVTSSVPGEGKTFNAINLAISIASEPDYRVLLVDADLLRPNIFETLGIEPLRGLIDAIENRDEKLSDLLVRTNIDGLTLLGAGTPHPMATELLTSERMRKFIDEIAQRYTDRVIIFDAPPVLLTSEPTALASHMSQIVFVIEAEHTSRAQVREALELIGPGPRVGLVLNKSRSQFGLRKFGEYYKSYRKSR